MFETPILKILFVSSLYPSAEQPQYCIFLEQQAQALQALGHCVEILRLSPSLHKNCITGPTCQNGLNVYTWEYPSRKQAERAVLPLASTAISPFLYKNNYSAVSLHMGSLRCFLCIAKVCASNNTPVFAHFHGLNIWHDYCENTKQKIIRIYQFPFQKAFLKKCSAVVGVSRRTCQIVNEHYHGPVFPVYNGVDFSRFSPKTRSFSAHHLPFRILCVANLIPIKGQTYLLQAIADCLSHGYSVELTLVGDGPEKTALQELCQKLDIVSQVHFLGVLPYSEVSLHMSEADMFIMPSYFEAFGCVYVEAMASGMLTCGCKNSGADEIIQHKQTGLLVDPHSVHSIVEMIEFAIDNPAEASKIAKKGFERAKDFSWQVSAEALASVYLSYRSSAQNE